MTLPTFILPLFLHFFFSPTNLPSLSHHLRSSSLPYLCVHHLKMGSCFSSETATNFASSVLNQVTSANDPKTHSPTHPSVKEIIPNCRVTKIPDGDTITCIKSDQTSTRVRIMGIDSPETKQNYGPEAGELARELLDGKFVTLHVHATDRYGRTVADVVVEDNSLNFGIEMLRRGAAWHYKDYDKRETYAQLEEDARSQKIGLWAWPRPTPPWDYRRRIREQRK